MPADSRLMKPARSMSRWLATSASAGASFNVEMKNWLAFIVAGSLRAAAAQLAHRPDRRLLKRVGGREV